ncbi:MAG: hypothetical protein AB8I69_15600 [Anaerolineae bacterium]|jgi:hypothetical protein
MFAKRALSCIILITGVVTLAIGNGAAYAAPTAKTPGPPGETGLTHPADATVDGMAMQAPPLTLFINIWVDDVDNRKPAVAYNSKHDEYLVVWANDRGATRDIYAQRVASDGTLKSWFCVVSDANQWNFLPAVAYNPTQDEYLIVYTYQVNTDDFDVYARRVKWNGADLDQPQYQEFYINIDSDKQWYPAVAYNSTNDEYLVVYENYWADGRRDIAAQRVSGVFGGGPGGGQLLSWRNIATAPSTVRRLPDVAYNAARNEYLIAYTYQAGATDGDICGKVATFDLGTLSIEIYIEANTDDQDAVSLAAGPDEYLVVWEDGTWGTSDYDVYARRVSGDGVLQGPSGGFSIASDTLDSHIEPDVAYGNVYGYLVTWRYASGGMTGDDVYGRFVEPGQDVPSDSQFVIDNDISSQREPALACSTQGECLVVEEDDWPGGDYEIRGRIVLAYHVYLPLVLRDFP